MTIALRVESSAFVAVFPCCHYHDGKGKSITNAEDFTRSAMVIGFQTVLYYLTSTRVHAKLNLTVLG